MPLSQPPKPVKQIKRTALHLTVASCCTHFKLLSVCCILYIVCFTKNKQKFLLCNCNLQSKNYKYSQKLNNTFMTIRNLCQCKFALTSISSGRFWQACCRVVSMCLFVNNIHCIDIIENCNISLKNTPIKLIFPDFFFSLYKYTL